MRHNKIGCSTSGVGHKRTFCDAEPLSTLPPIADMCSATRHVRFVPIADMPLLNNATGSQELETKSYLSPAEDSLAVEELDHTGFDRGGLVVRDHHRGDDGVAVVVERNGKGGSP